MLISGTAQMKEPGAHRLQECKKLAGQAYGMIRVNNIQEIMAQRIHLPEIIVYHPISYINNKIALSLRLSVILFNIKYISYLMNSPILIIVTPICSIPE